MTAVAAEQRKIDLNSRGWAAASTFEQQKAQTDEARGRVTRAARAVTLARNAFAYATLVADADGVVTAASVESGQVVSAGQTAVRVARTAEKEALVAIPEARVQEVRGGTARLTLWALPDRTFETKLRELSPAADASTRTFAARFTIADAPADLELGMTGTLTIAASDTRKIARLPLGALFNAGDGPAVWVVDEAAGAVTRRAVTVAGYESAAVLVSSGVADGDQVVALGVHKLDAGQKVRVVVQPGT
jgi:RND family efflux transporter MFP subunit